MATAPDGARALPWARAAKRLEFALTYWLATASPDGRPHAAPVWGVWQDGRFYFGTGRTTAKGRNLAANPRAVLHLENGDDVVLVETSAHVVTDAATIDALAVAFRAKYLDDVGQPLELTAALDGQDGVFYELRPLRASTWLEAAFLATQGRWCFADGAATPEPMERGGG